MSRKQYVYIERDKYNEMWDCIKRMNKLASSVFPEIIEGEFIKIENRQSKEERYYSIKKYMKVKGVTGYEVAQRIGVSPSQYSVMIHRLTDKKYKELTDVIDEIIKVRFKNNV